MNEMNIGVSRTTAIAVLNAAINQLERGHFVSQIDNYNEFDPLNSPRFPSDSTQIAGTGRTNTGWEFATDVLLITKTAGHRRDLFPYEKAVIMLAEIIGRKTGAFLGFFSCVFSESGMILKRHESRNDATNAVMADAA